METQQSTEELNKESEYKTASEYLNTLNEKHPEIVIKVRPLEKEETLPSNNFTNTDEVTRNFYPDGVVVETFKNNPYSENSENKVVHNIILYQNGQIIETKYYSSI